MKWTETETYPYWGATCTRSYIECDHNCYTCDEECEHSHRCSHCGTLYDDEYYNRCPECGYLHDLDEEDFEED